MILSIQCISRCGMVHLLTPVCFAQLQAREWIKWLRAAWFHNYSGGRMSSWNIPHIYLGMELKGSLICKHYLLLSHHQFIFFLSPFWPTLRHSDCLIYKHDILILHPRPHALIFLEWNNAEHFNSFLKQKLLQMWKSETNAESTKEHSTDRAATCIVKQSWMFQVRGIFHPPTLPDLSFFLACSVFPQFCRFSMKFYGESLDPLGLSKVSSKSAAGRHES